MSDINLVITDRDGNTHKVLAPTDMAMNLMEIIRSYELAPEGTIGVCGGMAMCASCQCYINSEHTLNDMQEDEEAMRVFLKTNQNEVHDPRYGYSISNFKNRGHSKVYPPNRRHVDRVYCLKKII